LALFGSFAMIAGQALPTSCSSIFGGGRATQKTGAAVDPLGSWVLPEMERGLSGLEIGHHFLGSIDGELITDREQYSPITLDGLVDFRALFTHNCRPILGGSERPPVTYLRWRQCFVSIEN
jgi:hypothetical protein